MEFNEVLNNLHTTHGNFTDKPISEADLQFILKSSVKGANASNRQSYSIIIIRGAENVKNITGCGYGSPLALVFCADYNRIYKVGERLGYPASDYDNIFNYLTGHTDAVIAAQTAVMTAISLGIGNMYTNSIHNLPRKDVRELCKQLEIPEEHCFPVIAVLLGYEDGSHPKAGKLTDKGIVHDGKYKPLTTADTDEIIAKVNNPANHFGDTNGCKDYLEYYYTKWQAPKPREMTEKIDNALLARLKMFLKKA